MQKPGSLFAEIQTKKVT